MFYTLEAVYASGDLIETEVAKGILDSRGILVRIKDLGATPYPVGVVALLSDKVIMTTPT